MYVNFCFGDIFILEYLDFYLGYVNRLFLLFFVFFIWGKCWVKIIFLIIVVGVIKCLNVDWNGICVKCY